MKEKYLEKSLPQDYQDKPKASGSKDCDQSWELVAKDETSNKLKEEPPVKLQKEQNLDQKDEENP